MRQERTSLLKALRSTPEMKKKTRQEFWGFGVVGTVVSVGLATGLILAGEHITSGLTDVVNGGLHNVGLNFRIPHLMEDGVNALGHLVNTVPGASVAPRFAAEHLSGISNSQDFWGTIESVTGVVAAGKLSLVGVEAGKRKVAHAYNVGGRRISGPLYDVWKAGHAVGKGLEYTTKLAEVVTALGDPTPFSVSDLLALSYILLGYRPKEGILSPGKILALSALLVLPLVPTITTYDLIRDGIKHGKGLQGHVTTLRGHADRILKP